MTDKDTFESYFQAWLERVHAGTEGALIEDLEREVRSRPDAPKHELCPHGTSPLRCSVCYFHGPGY